MSTIKNNKTDFSSRLRSLRAFRTQKEFAEFLGISSQQTYVNYEKGRVPKQMILQQISQRTRVSLDWLLGNRPADPSNPAEVDPASAVTRALGIERATITIDRDDEVTEQTLAASAGRRSDIEKLVKERLEELCMQEFPGQTLLIEDCTVALQRFDAWVKAYRAKLLAIKTEGEKIEP